MNQSVLEIDQIPHSYFPPYHILTNNVLRIALIKLKKAYPQYIFQLNIQPLGLISDSKQDLNKKTIYHVKNIIVSKWKGQNNNGALLSDELANLEPLKNGMIFCQNPKPKKFVNPANKSPFRLISIRSWIIRLLEEHLPWSIIQKIMRYYDHSLIPCSCCPVDQSKIPCYLIDRTLNISNSSEQEELKRQNLIQSQEPYINRVIPNTCNFTQNKGPLLIEYKNVESC